ncbi:hypothetical protein [Cyanobium sp. La Preciosa 7G6]|uniref:hypothetical protein n=1 Tax=Cyanobium sp. La Preciosa 7G6 TaxID=2823715 RepID=UPI0020CF2E87|nr:hypothetical protein [Cyanobium sp. La Preciosa 7G6]
MQLLIPRKPRDGNSAIADRGFPPLCSIAFEEIQMAFVNEVVSDEDIVKYNLPFKLGAGRYWTRDKERDCYLWGGIVESFAREYVPEGRFWLYLHGTCLDVSLNVASLVRGRPPEILPQVIWMEVSHIQPLNLGGLDLNECQSVLKEALLAFGLDGEGDTLIHGSIVKFHF